MGRSARAAVGGGLVAGVALGLEAFRSHGCTIFMCGLTPVAVRSALRGLWLFAFLILRYRGRMALLLGTTVLLASLFSINVDGAPVASRAASAVSLMRDLNEQLARASQEHPRQGYPEKMLPSSHSVSAEEIGRYYRFEYLPIRSPDGAVADYQLTAGPVRWDCGYKLSFATSADGRIHFTMENRAATVNDPPIEEMSSR